MLVEKTLAAYLEAVRKLLQTRNELSAKWIEELLEGDANYLQNCFEKKVHPVCMQKTRCDQPVILVLPFYTVRPHDRFIHHFTV